MRCVHVCAFIHYNELYVSFSFFCSSLFSMFWQILKKTILNLMFENSKWQLISIISNHHLVCLLEYDSQPFEFPKVLIQVFECFLVLWIVTMPRRVYSTCFVNFMSHMLIASSDLCSHVSELGCSFTVSFLLHGRFLL